MKTFLRLFFFILPFSLKGQLKFQESFGGIASRWIDSGIQTKDSGYFVAGRSGSGGIQDLGAVKVDRYGTLQSNYLYELSAEYCWINSMVLTGNDDILLSGAIDNASSIQFLDYWLRISPTGAIQWSKFYDTGTGAGSFVSKTIDNQFLSTGVHYTSFSDYDMSLSKFDTSGNILWAKAFLAPGNQSGIEVHQEAGGEIAIFGNYEYSTEGIVYFIKSDSSGNFLWGKSYSDSTRILTFVTGMLARDGGYLFAGRADDTTSWQLADFFLMKTDQSGNILWCKTYGGPYQELLFSVHETQDGEYLLVGRTDSYNSSPEALLIKADSAGNPVWSKTYRRGTDWGQGNAILESADGGYFICGSTLAEVYMVKTDTAGNSGCNEYNVFPLMQPLSVYSDTFIATVNTINPTPVTIATSSFSEGNLTILCSTMLPRNEMPAGSCSVEIFPNPFHKEAILEVRSQEFEYSVNRLKIYNALGIFLREDEIKPGMQNFLIRGSLADGLYFYELMGPDYSHKCSGKFVVR